jgi:serine/threonine-protein kinase
MPEEPQKIPLLRRKPLFLYNGPRFVNLRNIKDKSTPAEREAKKAEEERKSKEQLTKKRMLNDQILISSDRYKLKKFIGTGYSGKVYLADDTLLEMPIAIKILNSKLTQDKDALTDFKREVKLAMELSNPYIVRMYNLERKVKTYYAIMEYVDGESIREIQSRNNIFPLDFINNFIEFTCEALAHAHRRGIIHNDLKPENIMINREGIIKIIDFGIARLIKSKQNFDYIQGTPDYMSPEQIKAQALDERTDVYAMGIIAYELLAGKTPYTRGTSLEKLLEEKVKPLTGIKEPILRVLNHATHYNKEERIASMDIFSQEFLRASRM